LELQRFYESKKVFQFNFFVLSTIFLQTFQKKPQQNIFVYDTIVTNRKETMSLFVLGDDEVKQILLVPFDACLKKKEYLVLKLLKRENKRLSDI
jgi:hypothetical protein